MTKSLPEGGKPEVADEQRRTLLMEYRRYYEALKTTPSINGRCAAWRCGATRPARAGRRHGFGIRYARGRRRMAALFEGRYEIRETPFWHLAPAGRPGGRPYGRCSTATNSRPPTWNFFRPLPPLLRLNFPLALSVDIPKTYERNAAIDALEGIIQAYQVHLAGVSGEDSRSVQRIADCRRALQEINNGDALHLVQLTIAIAADDLNTLKERVQTVVNETQAWFSLRQEVGELLARSVGFFAAKRTKDIDLPTPPGRSRRANWR